jgi:hypothetical protein
MKDESGPGKNLVTKRIAVRGAIVALVVGAILIVLGTVVIWGAGHEVHVRFGGLNWDGLFIGYVCNVSQLVTGIILTLAGTATVSASLTYLLLNRKRKRV